MAESAASASTSDIAIDSYSINCWSGPRCCSTSLMYSFAQRTDTVVLDEPLYANYLNLTGVPRPYREQVRCVSAPCDVGFQPIRACNFSADH